MTETTPFPFQKRRIAFRMSEHTNEPDRIELHVMKEWCRSGWYASNSSLPPLAWGKSVVSATLELMIVHSKQRSTVPTQYHSTVRKSKFHANMAKSAFRNHNCGGSCACTNTLHPFVDNSEFFECGLSRLCIEGLSLHGNTRKGSNTAPLLHFGSRRTQRKN